MKYLGTTGNPSLRSVAEGPIIDMMLVGGWAYEVQGGNRQDATEATRVALARWQRAGPVSYTHLDVYKRQGKALVCRAGSDVTIATHSYMVRVAMDAAQKLQETGISAEVIDLRSLSPLDLETVAASVARTGALLTLEEGQATCGVGTEVAAQVYETLGSRPWARVGALRAPVSSNPVLEAACLPDAKRVVLAAHGLLGRRATDHTLSAIKKKRHP